MYTVRNAKKILLCNQVFHSCLMTKGRSYAIENNEKSLVYHWSLKLIEAFR